MEVKIIFQSLPYLVTQCNKVENWLFRNISFSVLEHSIVEILNFESLIKEKFATPRPSSVYYNIIFVNIMEIFCLL